MYRIRYRWIVCQTHFCIKARARDFLNVCHLTGTCVNLQGLPVLVHPRQSEPTNKKVRTYAHNDNLNCLGTSSDLFPKGPNEKRIYIRLILLFMRHWENNFFWSQGTFFKILGSPFLEEACHNCPDGCFWVSTIP